MTPGLHELIDILLSGEDARAELVLPALAAYAGEAVAALAQRLTSAQADDRWWIARACSEIHVPQSVVLLADLMNDPDSDVRACAALALGELGAVGGVEALVSHLADSSAHVAEVCTVALSRTGAAAVPALVQALEEGDALTRIRAAKALVPIESQTAIPALIRALDGENPIVAHYAEDALARMGIGMLLLQP